MKVCISGGTGFVGSHVVRALIARGDAVTVLTRDVGRARVTLGAGIEVAAFDPTVAPAPTLLAGVDAVLNLAGEPLAGRRWNPAVKQRIRASRLGTTRALVQAIASAPAKPAVLVSASAVGYYGGSLADTVLTEDGPTGADFLAGVCADWEHAAQAAATHTRVVVLRTGIVLGEGGALARMRVPFLMFAGGPVGSGRQWVSWIHIEDLVRLILRALDDSGVRGVLNAVAPEPVTMRELARALGRTLHRPSWLPAPAFALRALFGEGAEVLLLGQRVVPARAQALGFQFQHPEIGAALVACSL